jgi:hypothetical protein
MTLKKILLVEGKDDEHVLKHVSGNRGGPRFDEVAAHGGIDRLLDAIPVRLKAIADTAIVGIVVDADTDAAARWQALRDRLVNVGYEDFPQQPDRDGTVVDPPPGARLPRVGIWMMPDNRNTGILENFLRFLVPVGSPLFDHVTASIASIPKGEVRFGKLDEPKAVIHTWLAWQEEPGNPLGTAITARYLDPDVPEVNVLVTWLNRLYDS